MHISNLSLQGIPYDLTKFKNLTEIDLSNNEIRTFKAEVFIVYTPLLVILNLRNNKITDFEQFQLLGLLPKLERLDFRNNLMPVLQQRTVLLEKLLFQKEYEPIEICRWDDVRSKFFKKMSALPNIKNKILTTSKQQQHMFLDIDKGRHTRRKKKTPFQRKRMARYSKQSKLSKRKSGCRHRDCTLRVTYENKPKENERKEVKTSSIIHEHEEDTKEKKKTKTKTILRGSPKPSYLPKLNPEEDQLVMPSSLPEGFSHERVKRNQRRRMYLTNLEVFSKSHELINERVDMKRNLGPMPKRDAQTHPFPSLLVLNGKKITQEEFLHAENMSILQYCYPTKRSGAYNPEKKKKTNLKETRWQRRKRRRREREEKVEQLRIKAEEERIKQAEREAQEAREMMPFTPISPSPFLNRGGFMHLRTRMKDKEVAEEMKKSKKRILDSWKTEEERMKERQEEEEFLKARQLYMAFIEEEYGDTSSCRWKGLLVKDEEKEASEREKQRREDAKELEKSRKGVYTISRSVFAQTPGTPRGKTSDQLKALESLVKTRKDKKQELGGKLGGKKRSLKKGSGLGSMKSDANSEGGGFTLSIPTIDSGGKVAPSPSPAKNSLWKGIFKKKKEPGGLLRTLFK